MKFTCNICLEDHEIENMLTLNCNHQFCKACLVDMWKNCIT